MDGTGADKISITFISCAQVCTVQISFVKRLPIGRNRAVVSARHTLFD